MRFYFDDNLDNFGQHYIRCCVLILTTTETTFLGNLQLPFCVRGGVYNTPRCLCCRHIKCKVVKFGVVSCCLCCRFIFTRLQNSSVTTLPLGKSPITGENAYKNINFRPLSRNFPWFGHHVLAFSTLKCPSRRISKSFTPNWASKATRLPHAQACKARDWRGSARASLHQRRRNHRSRYARRFLRQPRQGISLPSRRIGNIYIKCRKEISLAALFVFIY